MDRKLGDETEPNSRPSIEEMEIDAALKQFSPISKFGIALTSIIFFVQIFADYNIVLSFFTGHDPSWRCVATNASSEFCSLHKNKTFTSNNDLFNKRCHLDRSEWVYTTSKDYSLITEYDLVCSKTWVSAFYNAIFHLGGIISAACTGAFADRYGRKLAIMFFLIMTLIMSLGCSYTTNIWLLLILNVLRGIGHAGYRYGCAVYMIECSHPSYKSANMSVMSLAGSLSFLLIDLCAYFLPIWRALSRYASLPSIIMITLLFFFPESPRWLLATKKKQQAEKTMMKMARFNDKTTQGDIRLKSKEETVSRTYTYFDLVRNWKIARLTGTLFGVWFVVPLLYYSIAFQSTFGGSIYTTFALSTVADIPATFLCPWLLEKLGRKKCNLGGLIIAGVLTGSLFLVPQSKSYSYALNMTIVSIARLCICVTYIGIFLWTTELYPTVLRAQGLCLCGVVDRCGMFCIPFLINWLQNYIQRGTFLIMATFSVIAFLIGLTIPETKGKPLTESYEDFIQENNGMDNRGLEE